MTAQDVLAAITNTEAVSVTQMCGRMGINSRSRMRRWLKQLVRDGYVRRMNPVYPIGRTRSIYGRIEALEYTTLAQYPPLRDAHPVTVAHRKDRR